MKLQELLATKKPLTASPGRWDSDYSKNPIGFVYFWEGHNPANGEYRHLVIEDVSYLENAAEKGRYSFWPIGEPEVRSNNLSKLEFLLYENCCEEYGQQ